MPDTLAENKKLVPDREARALRDSVLAELAEHPFEPPAWLKNAHLQTVGGRYLRRFQPAPTTLERWVTPDDDFLRVHTVAGDSDKPIAILSHGLEGCIASSYMTGTIRELQKMGWNVAAFEHRSCGGEMNRAQRMYHSGETTDLAFVVDRIAERHPGKPIYLAGFSLGANQIAKWFGESGGKLPDAVRAAAVISAPFDLVESQKYLDTGIRRLYVLHFLQYLIPKAVEKDRMHPGILDIERIKRTRKFVDFDDLATARLHGFDDAHHYYTSVACGQFLSDIRRPTMILSSNDDPFNPGHTIPRGVIEGNPHLIPQITKHGGHVGFVRRHSGAGVGYWAEEQIARFFQAIDSRVG